jgi:uncharacterized protein (TIGR02996 family)
MSDESAFLASIIAAPDDDAPRLVYADLLEENGDPGRAEFIRVGCELARWSERKNLVADDWFCSRGPGYFEASITDDPSEDLAVGDRINVYQGGGKYDPVGALLVKIQPHNRLANHLRLSLKVDELSVP